jgi:hypothetical protein
MSNEHNFFIEDYDDDKEFNETYKEITKEKHDIIIDTYEKEETNPILLEVKKHFNLVKNSSNFNNAKK